MRRTHAASLGAGACGIALLVLSGALAACSAEEGAQPIPGDAAVREEQDASRADAGDASGEGAAIDASVYAVVDLPRTDATQGLSGTYFDEAASTLFAIQDTRARVVPLVAAPGLRAFAPGTPIDLAGRPDPAWDGEGIVRSGAELVLVTVETGPRIERFDTRGNYLGPVTLPARFASQAPGNKGMESLALSPTGRFLFTANEAALTADGPVASKSAGTTVRIVRREMASGSTTEHAYRTEPLGAGSGGGDMGVSELAALSDDALLVLERGFQPGYGNTVRIFRVSLVGAPDVSNVAALDGASPVLAKQLVADIGALPPSGATHPGPQPNPLLDNYESLSVGPTLGDGQRLLFLTSDDNASAAQIARVLVLAVRGL